MVKVKFIVGGANSAFGGFCAGDILACSEAMADHLVNEVGCAKYEPARQAATQDAVVQKRGRKAKG